MSSILVFGFVLALAGGLIAWLGDWLGTKVGKKRLTFGLAGWRLRPRHTATLYTVCSGSLIAVLTLLVLITFDYSFKKALLEGPQLVALNDYYKNQVGVQQVKAEKAQLAAKQAEYESSRAQEKFLVTQDRLSSVQQQLGQQKERLRLTEQKLATTKIALAHTSGQLSQARQSVQTAQGQVMAAKRKVQALTDAGKQLIAANEDLLIKAVRRGQVRNAALLNPLTYHSGEEVGRAVIRTDQPVGEIRKDLGRFLHDLRRDAVQRGSLRQHGVLLQPEGPASGGPAFEAQSLAVLAQNIAEKARKVPTVVVVARAKFNAFQGEPVVVFLKPYANIRVYRPNTIVASQVIDGTQSDAQVSAALQMFIAKIRVAARRRGVIPQTDPATGAPFVGALDLATVLDLMRRIHQTGANAQVVAYTTESTYSSGPLPLPLRYDVVPAGQMPRMGEAPASSPDLTGETRS